MRGNRPLIGLAAAIVIGLAFWFLLYSPRSTEIEDVRAETAALETERQSLQNEVAQLREVERNQVEIRAALAQLEEYIPSGTAQSSVIRQLQLAADAAGVEILSLTFSEPQAVEDAPPTGVPDTVLARIPISVTLDGGYFQAVDFLRRIEVEIVRAMLLTDLSLEEGEDGFPALSTSWSGSLFAIVPLPPPVAEPPPPPGGDGATEETEDTDTDEEATP
jgi:Tfp pilus assembly protein PilO